MAVITGPILAVVAFGALSKITEERTDMTNSEAVGDENRRT